MKKKQPGVVPFLISLFLIGGLYEPALRFLRYLSRRPFMGLDTFRRLPADQLLTLAGFLLGCILFVSSIVQMIRSAPAAKRPASGGASPAGETARSTAVTRKSPAAVTRKSPAGAKPHPSIRLHAPDSTEAEEAIHCAHLTGRAKYLEQLDSFLKTGLIDREEYRVLKERYMRLDIPDDYH